MKTKWYMWCLLGVLALGLTSGGKAGEEGSARRYEYATIRWGGRDNTHVIRPSGAVEFVGTELAKITRPSHADDRALYMNAIMNGLAKEGYEFVGMDPDEIIMRRPASH